jgi:pectinesterase
MGAVLRADVHFTVGPTGQYATVQAAVDAVPANNTVRHVINIQPGTYNARVKIPSTKPFITLRGEDPLTTVLTFNETAATLPNESTVHATTVLQGADFVAENITFGNHAGRTAGQALAVYIKADRQVFNNCRFTGWQDTLRSEQGRHLFYNSYVEGSVDFIYGKGTAYFENATIVAKANGYLTAQAREGATETNGYVFKNAAITGASGVANGSVYLGRPWQAYSRSVFIDSQMSPVINAAGWATWSGSNHLTSFFAEYNSRDLNGNPINVAGRASWSKQLTASEAEAFSKATWLSGWNPTLSTLIPGDYNNDGTVDTADYTTWRDAKEGGGSLWNETVTFGVVDAEDYNVWAAGLGSQSPASASGVPEPGAMVLMVVMVVVFFHQPPRASVRIDRGDTFTTATGR